MRCKDERCPDVCGCDMPSARAALVNRIASGVIAHEGRLSIRVRRKMHSSLLLMGGRSGPSPTQDSAAAADAAAAPPPQVQVSDWDAAAPAGQGAAQPKVRHEQF